MITTQPATMTKIGPTTDVRVGMDNDERAEFIGGMLDKIVHATAAPADLEVLVTVGDTTVPLNVARERMAAACDEFMAWSYAVSQAERPANNEQ